MSMKADVKTSAFSFVALAVRKELKPDVRGSRMGSP